ncbi:MAG: CRISPR-associated helicase Cas3' [Eubacteriaceae bacterium]
MEYLAHYDKETEYKQLLKEHLETVGKEISTGILSNINFDNICFEEIRQCCYYMGYLHDIGKYISAFQDYLKNNINNELKIHAPISACFVYNYLNSHIKKTDKEDTTIFYFLIYLCVKLHHTSLNVEMFSPCDHIWNTLKKQEIELKSISNSIIGDLHIKEITEEEFGNCFCVETIQMSKLKYIPIRFMNGRISNPKWYFLFIYMFSLLIDRDKLNSASINMSRINHISHNSVTYYINNMCSQNNTVLIRKRQEARENILSVLGGMSEAEIRDTYFFTLTAPTGIGKTLSSLQSVLYLQGKIREIEKYSPKIIVAIPFINIIDQYKKVYEDVFGENINMVVHHRLADFSVSSTSDEGIPLDKTLLQIESWEGDVILTTFVQLFHSIFTGKNKLLKKINKIAGSIVILDEVQSIPQEYMPLIGAVLKMMAKYYGTRFVLMTATQPKILNFADKLLDDYNIRANINIKNLLPRYKSYFNNLNRTKFIPLLSKKLATEEFLEFFFQKWSPNISSLIVVNTIKRSIDIYQKIQEELAKRKISIPIYYLSTNIVPKQRQIIIKRVGQILNDNKPVLLVSTQTIEAGVDLDFDMGFRDFAPIDSLIQTAGRINRSGKKGDFLPIYIVKLGDDNNFVYGLSYRIKTERLLIERKEIFEYEYIQLAEEYYQLALNEGISHESKRIWEAIIKLKFDTIEEFRLIKNIGEVYDVFIELDEEASKIADIYGEVFLYSFRTEFDYSILSEIFGDHYKHKNKQVLGIYEKKAILKLLEGKLSQYIVQVRISRLLKNRPIEFSIRSGCKMSMYWVPQNQLNEYYNLDTGFIDENGEALLY